MKPAGSNNQNKPNLLNDYLNRNALSLNPKPTNAYQRVTFSPKGINFSPKKPNVQPLDSTTNDQQPDTSGLTKSELLGNNYFPKASPNHMYRLNIGSPTGQGPAGYSFNSRIKDNDKSKTLDETQESNGANDPATSSGRKRKYTPNTLNAANGRSKEGQNEPTKNKKNLEIQTRFQYSTRPFSNVKPETTTMSKTQKGENSWLGGIVYPNSSLTPQVSGNNSAQNANHNFVQGNEPFRAQGFTPSNYKRETLIKAYGSTETRKRPLSSATKPLPMQLKNNDHAFPDLAQKRENANRSANRKTLSQDKTDVQAQEALKLKYKLVRNDEGSFEISTPKENFTQLLSDINKKAYDQQLKEIKSTLKNIRMTKGGSPALDSKETPKQSEQPKNFEVKGHHVNQTNQVNQEQEPDSAKSNLSVPNKNSASLSLSAFVSQYQDPKLAQSAINTRFEAQSPQEKTFSKPQHPKYGGVPLGGGSRAAATRMNLKNPENPTRHSKTPDSPLARNKQQSDGKVAEKPKEAMETLNSEDSAPRSNPRLLLANYYQNNMKKHWKRYNEKDYFCRLYREHFYQMFQEMKAGKSLRPVDQNILARKSVYLPKRESHKDKKTLIFDLDETLIHCNASENIPSDVVLPIKLNDGNIVRAGINIRPYAVEILKEMSQYYEIMIFTASHSCYANVVLDYLDPNNEYIHHRLYRESCIQTRQGMNVKDLRIIKDRNLSDMVLVDNSGNSFGYQVANGIPCAPYYDNKADKELLDLMEYLKQIRNEPDLRVPNKNTFKLHAYSKYVTPKEVLENVIFQN